MFEQQVQNLESSQFTLENMKIQSDMMRDQIEVVGTMKQSAQAQKQLMGEMNADTMYDMALDMQEMKSDLEEMNEVFMESYKVDIDDGELDAELDELDFDMKDTDFNVQSVNAPNQKLVSKKEMDEKKLEDELMN
mmetsp:Transcript_33368/g.34674  ORF Transcript_33368/g.34674 Transcript_33368/m.34674 type:complete len:135 (-) Transcript_33368:41-445(-)